MLRRMMNPDLKPKKSTKDFKVWNIIQKNPASGRVFCFLSFAIQYLPIEESLPAPAYSPFFLLKEKM